MKDFQECEIIKKPMGCVYIIEREENDIKIGKTINIETRLPQIENTAGFSIRRKHYSELCSNYSEIEKKMHDIFREYRKKGEWFNVSFENAIKELDNVFSEYADLEERYTKVMGIEAIDNGFNKTEKEPKLISLEIAEIMEIEHWMLLRKLEGQEKNGKHIKGYIEHLADNEIVVSDFFIQTHYLDDSNKQNKAYWFTKKGCEFIAHKLTGAKGTVFTARYINRFHEMEDVIRGNQVVVAEQTTAISIPDKSPTCLPKALDWFDRNRKRIRRICDIEDMTHSELYHIILSRCGKEFDLNAANEIYNRERGYYPKYAIDIVGYFPQLEEIADKILDRFDVPEKTRKRKRRR